MTAESLRAFRDELMLSQRMLANQIGVATVTLAGWEQGAKIPAWLPLALDGLRWRAHASMATLDQEKPPA